MTTGQLLIEQPIVFERAVLFNVNNRQDEVFLKLFETLDHYSDMEDYRQIVSFMEDWHRTHRKHAYMQSNGCGCAYCTKTREYANLKLNIHRLRYQLDNGYSLWPSEQYKSSLAFLNKQERRLTELIKERKTMRVHLGYASKRVLKDI